MYGSPGLGLSRSRVCAVGRGCSPAPRRAVGTWDRNGAAMWGGAVPTASAPQSALTLSPAHPHHAGVARADLAKPQPWLQHPQSHLSCLVPPPPARAGEREGWGACALLAQHPAWGRGRNHQGQPSPPLTPFQLLSQPPQTPLPRLAPAPTACWCGG